MMWLGGLRWKYSRSSKDISLGSRCVRSSGTPDIFPRTPDIFPRTPDIFPRIPDIFPRTPDSFPRTPDIFPRTPDIFPRTPDIFPRTPFIYILVPQIVPQIVVRRIFVLVPHIFVLVPHIFVLIPHIPTLIPWVYYIHIPLRYNTLVTPICIPGLVICSKCRRCKGRQNVPWNYAGTIVICYTPDPWFEPNLIFIFNTLETPDLYPLPPLRTPDIYPKFDTGLSWYSKFYSPVSYPRTSNIYTLVPLIFIPSYF